MKVEIQQGAQNPSKIKYPCVMAASVHEFAIAMCEKSGIYLDPSGCVIQYAPEQGGMSWSEAGFIPATGPVTITLTNE